MTENEYYYNVELLELLEDLLKTIPNIRRNESYFISRIDSLK